MKHISKIIIIVGFMLSSYFLIQDTSVYILQRKWFGTEIWDYILKSTGNPLVFLAYAVVLGTIVYFLYDKIKRVVMALTVAYSIILMGDLAEYLLIFMNLFFDIPYGFYGLYKEMKIIIFLALWIGLNFLKPGKDDFDLLKISTLSTLPFLLFMSMYRIYSPVQVGGEILVLLFSGGVIFLAVPIGMAVWVNIKNNK
ncbi:hypothetical protein [Mangrovibacillus cuniculi]|uniref:Uncharacterized protein n=1 Tax=Mangrovibacillus cuniculi TaxID=2593652 RepID=A0A7S8CCR7_9BACI|nr:hypothetical protein [Mangrovibacillus cuniculi]QPC47595.1 hypothetical protein G8O30_11845 [Mangrovibacillus cuniculi]